MFRLGVLGLTKTLNVLKTLVYTAGYVKDTFISDSILRLIMECEVKHQRMPSCCVTDLECSSQALYCSCEQSLESSFKVFF